MGAPHDGVGRTQWRLALARFSTSRARRILSASLEAGGRGALVEVSSLESDLGGGCVVEVGCVRLGVAGAAGGAGAAAAAKLLAFGPFLQWGSGGLAAAEAGSRTDVTQA